MKYSVTESLKSDVVSQRAQTLRLWERNLADTDATRFDWLYTSHHAVSWFVSSEDGQIIGAAGLMHRTMKLDDEDVATGQAIDLNVDQEHRSVGPALCLQRKVIQEVLSGRLRFVYGLPNPRAEAVLRRVGYQTVGTVERWAKPLRSFDPLLRKLKSSLLARLAAPFVDAALRFHSMLFLARPQSFLRIETTRIFDNRFDRLWKRAHRQFSIIGERTADYLNWRFRDCPELEYSAFCLVNSADDELLGYIVFYESDSYIHIVDLLFQNVAACDNLLCEFVRFGQRQKWKSIDCICLGSNMLTSRLKRFGFSKRVYDRKLMVFCTDTDSHEGNRAVTDRENWYLTRADYDTDH